MILITSCGSPSADSKTKKIISDQEQLEVIRISRSRMDGWQQKSFDKAYKEKVETGTSPIKKQKLQD